LFWRRAKSRASSEIQTLYHPARNFSSSTGFAIHPRHNIVMKIEVALIVCLGKFEWKSNVQNNRHDYL